MFTKYSGRSIGVIHVITTRNVKGKIYAELLSSSRPFDEMSESGITIKKNIKPPLLIHERKN